MTNNQWLSHNSFSKLESQDIHIWLNYLNVHEARIKHLYPLLSTEEKERSERFKFYKHRKAFIASHGFMHTVLSYYLDTPANEITFSQTEHGKPFISEPQNKHDIQFNLSHSNNMAILAICKKKSDNNQSDKKQSVGIDIEYAERKADWLGLSKRFFTADEQQQFFQLDENIQKETFFKIWTRKEAHMKVTGLGLSLAPTQFEISIPPADAAFIKNLKTPDNQFYKMQDIQIPDMFKDYYACLSADFDFQQIIQFIHS